MQKIFAGLLTFFFCSACLRAKIVQVPGYWLGAFPPYLEAKFLCAQNAPASPGKPASNYYTAAYLPSQIFAFYADQGLAEEFTEPSTGEYIWQTPDGRTLQIINAFEQHPDCGGRIPANTHTIFIVSEPP